MEDGHDETWTRRQGRCGEYPRRGDCRTDAKHIPQWWGRYQPVDYGVIEGALGSEAEYQQMNDAAGSDGMQIISDVVLNHTVITEQPNPPFIIMSGNVASSDTFPQFSRADFHARCNSPATEQSCWLSNNLVTCDIYLVQKSIYDVY